MKKKGKVYLIGAGPGDPGLLTLKGKECLQKADVVIYDYLANPKLLEYVRKEAKTIYAGKKAGSKAMPQEEINRLIVEKAKEGKVIARLKGGDPFIFGRGGEEGEELAKAGILFEVVPGVTSASAAPAYAGIPLSHRDFTPTFAVATGREDTDKEGSNLPWQALVQIGTVVFLMGIKNIEENMKKLIEHGRSPDTPAAAIRWGTLPNQSTVTGTIGTIAEIIKEIDFKPPAVVVVGEIVRLRTVLNWFETKPLYGLKVLVTRTRRQASILSKLLEEHGAEPVEFPTIEVVPPTSWKEMDQAIESLSSYDWLIFTSVNGVDSFFSRLKILGKDIRELKGIMIATIGEKTGKRVEELRIRVDLIPDEYRAEGLIESFKELDTKRKRILIPRAKEAREILPEKLKSMGAHVDVVAAYETVKPDVEKVEEIKGLFQRDEIDVVTFASSSTVRNFLSIFPEEGREFLSKTVVACIGPITAEPMREIGIEPQIVSKKYTMEELVKEIVNYFTRP